MTRALQHSFYSVAVFFILTQDFIFALVSENQKYQVYYDGDWKPVPLLAATNASTLTRSPLRRYGLIPCECADLQCGCCANTNFFSTQRSGCMNMTYDPQEFSIGMNMLWNGESVYQNSISAKNPPPACMEAPIPYLPSIQFCIKLFDIYTPGRNIHMCINFETRVARAPILGGREGMAGGQRTATTHHSGLWSREFNSFRFPSMFICLVILLRVASAAAFETSTSSSSPLHQPNWW
ncbi:hypothetical protein GE061_001386 [Apolygus lucorum]|uniref:DUF4773 domain-containing protein n=1 Tax=Apolygus lucorum TaxID=248454 RepID=A0A8S9Y784_APOLU|nr:hypothetical protein GE061_001386 [Apolygus lucorum]